jgi:hypothetical protein
LLPPSLQEIVIKDLSLPAASANLVLRRNGDDVVVNLVNKSGDFELIIKK